MVADNMNNPVVSIGLPVYNRPHFLEITLKSILGQSYKNLEIIISDDFSPDPEVVALVERHMENDARIKLFKQEKNIGAVLNHHFVLKMATGRYYFWASEDDEWDEKFIETGVMALIGDSKYNAWLCTVNNTDSHGRVIREYEGFSRYTSSQNKKRDLLKYLLEPGILGKPNIFHSLFERDALIRTIDGSSFKSNQRVDMCFNFAFIVRYNLIAVDDVLFNKRVIRKSDKEERVDPIIIKNPYKYCIVNPGFYYGYYKAARNTRYKYFVLCSIMLIWPYMFVRKYLSLGSMKSTLNRVLQKMGYRIVKVK